MDLILLAIIVIQFAYIVFKDIQNSSEREKLQLKLMSKDITEYTHTLDKPAKEVKEKPNPYVDIMEVSAEDILNAEDNL